MTVRRGENVALCGMSGSGKSTIVGLIERYNCFQQWQFLNVCRRFYNAKSGTVALDGKDIKEYNLLWLRSQVGLITQTPVLLPGTIYENISIGKEGATKEEVERAAKLAHAHDFISSFPSGYQTQVGELGSQLSGGQRQRIAIARVMINDPKILLADEATSALDNASEAAVQEALEDAASGRTTITIAHRLSTIKNADRIAVLRQGLIAELGSHQELMEKRGLYYEMVLRDGEVEEHDVSSKDVI